MAERFKRTDPARRRGGSAKTTLKLLIPTERKSRGRVRCRAWLAVKCIKVSMTTKAKANPRPSLNKQSDESGRASLEARQQRSPTRKPPGWIKRSPDGLSDARPKRLQLSECKRRRTKPPEALPRLTLLFSWPTSRLTDAAPIGFKLKTGGHRGIRCSRLGGVVISLSTMESRQSAPTNRCSLCTACYQPIATQDRLSSDQGSGHP